MTERAVQDRRSEIENSQNDGGTSSSKNYNVSKSYKLKDEWHTDLTKAQVETVEGWLHRAGTHEAKKIADTAYWYKGRIGEEDLFVIYSYQDTTGPTILYEVKGDKAQVELNILTELLEEIENGESLDGKSENIDTVLSGSWVQKGNNSANNQTNLGTGGNTQNAAVLQGQSKGNGSRAFWNVVENLFGTSNDRGISYSLKENTDTSSADTEELLDTIEQLKREFEITKFAKADPKKLAKFTKGLLKDYDSKLYYNSKNQMVYGTKTVYH